MHILIVKLGSIGDVIHTLPSLAVMRRAMPEAEISWVVESRSAEVLRANRMIHHLIEVDTKGLRGGSVIEDMLLGAGRQLKGLRAYSYDVAIDFQGLWKSALIAKLSGARRRFGFSHDGLREPGSRVLLTDPVSVQSGIHVIRKNLALLQGALGIDVPDSEFEFPIETGAEHLSEAAAIISQVNSPRFAVLNPAGGWVTKLWEPQKFGDLADRLFEGHGIRSLVVTGPRESELAERVALRSANVVLAEPSLKGFYEIARRAAVYVGGDTGPTHLAVAAGAPVVGIFGPTEWWRNGSPRDADMVVERLDIGCRVDCHRRTCSNWICMDIEPARVYAAVERRLATAGVAMTG